MRIRCVLLTCCILLSGAGLALAEPFSGVGLFGGLTSSRYSEPGLSLNMAGVAFGVDYQAAVSPQVSINPHLLFSHEEGQDVEFSDPFLGTFVFETEFDYTVVGVHVLFWPKETFYLGGGIANHSVKLTLTEKTTRTSASDTQSDIGLGLALGYADPGGLTLGARYDSVEIQGSTIGSLRLLIGYRFKPR